MRRRELRLVLVLQDALELEDALVHERPPCLEVYRPSFRHLLRFRRASLLGPGRHFGSRDAREDKRKKGGRRREVLLLSLGGKDEK